MVTPSLEWETLLAFPRATFRENAQVLLKRSHDLELERKNPLRWPHPVSRADIYSFGILTVYVEYRCSVGGSQSP